MRTCVRAGCTNPALPTDERCEDHFADDQALCDGRPTTVRTDKRPRGEYAKNDEPTTRLERLQCGS